MIPFVINRNASGENETLQLTSRPQLVDMTVPTVSDSEVKKLRATCTAPISIRELTGWVLVAILLSILILVITVLAIKTLYTKRTADRQDQPDHNISQDCKMEGNPCYETTTFRQVTTSSAQACTHDYQYLH